MELLNCSVQNYLWGKVGEDSVVASLKRGNDESFRIDHSQSYAEFWIGTHPNGPSRVKSTNQSFLKYLQENKCAIGRVPVNNSSEDLPFMLKVLSIKTALSIQSHPDKTLAIKLHKKYPEKYKDPNHKPEMAVALTAFEGMCGFRSMTEIKENLILFPELAHIIGLSAVAFFLNSGVTDDSCADDKRKHLQILFRAFMECPEDTASIHIRSLVLRLQSDSPVTLKSDSETTYLSNLILRLNADYPDDRGAVCPLLLNCLRLQPGEAFFMGPNEPHAYISGDCVECMALSDNTIRAGLTPKHKDVDTLLAMLHYRCGAPSCLLPPLQLDPYTDLYRPPADLCAEFEVERCRFPPHMSVENSPPAVPCGSLLIVLKGRLQLTVSSPQPSLLEEPTAREYLQSAALELHPGSVVFIPAATTVAVRTQEEGCEAYRAHVNLGDV